MAQCLQIQLYIAHCLQIWYSHLRIAFKYSYFAAIYKLKVDPYKTLIYHSLIKTGHFAWSAFAQTISEIELTKNANKKSFVKFEQIHERTIDTVYFNIKFFLRFHWLYRDSNSDNMWRYDTMCPGIWASQWRSPTSATMGRHLGRKPSKLAEKGRRRGARHWHLGCRQWSEATESQLCHNQEELKPTKSEWKLAQRVASWE